MAADTCRFDYAAAIRETVPCGCCEGRSNQPFCRRDRNGLPVTSVICENCGLMFISPRMTHEWYGRYYEVEYRRQTGEFLRKPTAEKDLDSLFAKQSRRGEWLANYLRRNGVTSPRRILDVGSSAGGLLHGLRQAFGSEIQGVEPSPVEAKYACEHGVPTQVGLCEDFQMQQREPFDLVLCSQTFNHLLHPRKVSETIRSCLTPEGAFFIECQDFFYVCQNRSAIYEATQIDHVYMFVPETLSSLLNVAGFEVVEGSLLCDRFQTAAAIAEQRMWHIPSTHMRLIARPSPPSMYPTSRYSNVLAELATMPNSRFKAWFRQRQRSIRRMKSRLGDMARGR